MNSLIVVAGGIATLALPLVPAFMELLRPTDMAPLHLDPSNRADASRHLDPEDIHHSIRLMSHAVAQPYLMATERVVLEHSSRFNVIQAPVIRTEATTIDLIKKASRKPLIPNGPGDAVEGASVNADAGWWFAKGDAKVGKNALILRDIVANGNVVIGPGATVKGSIKARGDVIIHRLARVEGNVVANAMGTGHGAFIQGNVLTETKLRLGAGTRVGTPSRPATVASSQVLLSQQVTVYGGISARCFGEFRAA